MDARKERYGESDLSDVFADASKVIAMKGKKVVTFDMKKNVDEAELAKAVLGPSGNLRAPTAKVGKTYLVGFNQEGFEDVFGA